MEPFHLNFSILLMLAFFALSLFLEFFLVNSSAHGHCLQEESSTLLQLKQGFTSGELDTWHSGTDCCIWEGITCDESRRVVSLNLSNHEIVGMINTSLFNLTSLHTLDLSWNNFDGTKIPDSGWSRLANLSSLKLSNAGFFGKIPIGISNLMKLTILNLSNNFELYSSADATIFKNMSGLKELHLDNINLSTYGDKWCGSTLVNSTPVLEILSMYGCSLFGSSCSSLSMLPFLSHLNLGGNNLDSSILNTFVNLTSLSVLRLEENEFNGVFPKQILQIKNLEYFDISENPKLSGSLPDFLEGSNLKILRTYGNNFSGSIPDTIGNLKFLKELDLSTCKFSGRLPLSMGNTYQLELLDLSFNNFNDVVELDLSTCKFSGRLPLSMGNTYQLELLDLSFNNFNDVVELEFIKNFRNLKLLRLSNSGFSLNSWDVDDGSLTSFFPNMSELGLASCNLTKVPSFIKYQYQMTSLDLSNNSIHGEISSWIWRIPLLNLSCNLFTHIANPVFNLSHFPNPHLANPRFNFYNSYFDLHSNMLEGHFPILGSINIQSLDLSYNRFTSSILSNISANQNLFYLSLANNNLSGEIPLLICNLTKLNYLGLYNNMLIGYIPPCLLEKLYYLSIANNRLTGEIPQSICNLTKLQALDLSYNRLAGSIPPCLFEECVNLNMLNLRGNQLHGAIPHQINPKCMLQLINLRDNQLDGMLPRSLSNCQSLVMLDLGNNKLNDTFPYWLGNMSSLKVLVLRFNKFHGLIGPLDGNHEINYAFSMLHVLDISSNNFYGNLCEECFNNFKSMMVNESDTAYNSPYVLTSIYYHLDMLTIINKGQVMEFQKLWMIVKSIDFSNNHFEGEIPISISQLVSLKVLNLSHNYLTGEIPPQLGKLSQLESLDLSMNRLLGKIPQDLVALTMLSSLNLSYNKLVGQIPSGGQFSTFPNNSFEGNEGLCWFPCKSSVPTSNNSVASTLGLGGTAPKNKNYMIVMGILFGVGFGASMAITIVIDVIYCDKARKKRNKRSMQG